MRGESIKGSITFKPKDIIKKSLLLCPIIANVTLQEEHNNGLTLESVEEQIILFKFPMNIPKFEGNSLINGMTIPFEFQVPQNAYPTCIFEEDCYVRHILIFDFSSIELKKSAIIIIKNSQYYSEFNELYKSPVEVKFNRVKHKYAIFNMGSINASAKLEKNVFGYDEVVPLQIDIICQNLKIRIQKINICIYLTTSKKNKLKKTIFKSEQKVFCKIIKLLQKKDSYHLEDIIHLSKGNPNDIYKKLESNSKIGYDIFKNISLYPTCYGGLLTCEYTIKITFETDTLFSTNESLCIPIDFYAKKIEGNKFEEKELDLKSSYLPLCSNILVTPMPMSNAVQKDNLYIHRSSTQAKDIFNDNDNNFEKNKTIINRKNDSIFSLYNDELNINKPKPNINNNNSGIIQEMVTAENEIESFDAPPCIIQDQSNKNEKK